MRRQEREDPSKARPVLRELPEDQLKQILADHRVWLESDGQRGLKGNLSHAQLQGLSLWRAARYGRPVCGGQISASQACKGLSWTMPTFRVPISTRPISPGLLYGERS